jgi:hypothetical protein
VERAMACVRTPFEPHEGAAERHTS